MKKRLLILAFIFAATAADATVIGVSPGTLTFKNATRGEEHILYLTLSTTDKEIITTANPQGQTAQWITFDKKTFTVKADEQYRLPVKLTVPETTPNGVYYGSIEIISTPSTDQLGGTGMNVGAAIYVRNIIEVTGSEGTMFRILKVAVSNAKEGEPANLEITAKNNDQTPVKPIIQLKVLSADKEKTYYETTLTEETVEPLSRKTITADIPTERMPIGIYLLNIKINNRAQDAWTSQETFYILSQKTENTNILVSGNLEKAMLSSENLTLGETLTITASFKNTGEAPVNAKLKANIIKDGRTIATQESPNAIINSSEEKEMYITYQPPQSGEYSIQTWIDYSGQRTTVRAAKIKVWTISKPLFGLDQNFYLIILPVIVIILLWLIFYYREYYQRED